MSKKITKAVLPTAGLGTRFLPATKASPKEMLPIVDKPMIQYAVEEAQRCGIKEFLMVTGKSKRAIEDHFDSAWELEENLKSKGKKKMLNEIRQLSQNQFAYIRQGKPLGLGHAILCAKPFIKNEAFAVLLSDDIIDPDDNLLGSMMRLYNKYQATILALQRVPKSEIHRYGVIAGREIKKNIYKISDMVEKPSASSAPSDLAIQLTDALKALLKRKPIYGFLFDGRRYDAGDKVGYLKATVELALKSPSVKTEFRKYLLSTILTLQKEK